MIHISYSCVFNVSSFILRHSLLLLQIIIIYITMGTLEPLCKAAKYVMDIVIESLCSKLHWDDLNTFEEVKFETQTFSIMDI